jgi:hypothetical protein
MTDGDNQKHAENHPIPSTVSDVSTCSAPSVAAGVNPRFFGGR